MILLCPRKSNNHETVSIISQVLQYQVSVIASRQVYSIKYEVSNVSIKYPVSDVSTRCNIQFSNTGVYRYPVSGSKQIM